MKCVECGQITLDEPIDKPLPELAKLPIMQKGEGSNSPFTLVPASQSIALRHLLTYASGMTYDMMDPTVMAWRACHGEGTVAMLRTDSRGDLRAGPDFMIGPTQIVCVCS